MFQTLIDVLWTSLSIVLNLYIFVWQNALGTLVCIFIIVKYFINQMQCDRMVARAELQSCASPGEQSSLSALPVAATSSLFPL